MRNRKAWNIAVLSLSAVSATAVSFWWPIAGIVAVGIAILIAVIRSPQPPARIALVVGLAASTGAGAGILIGNYIPLRGAVLILALGLFFIRVTEVSRLILREGWLLLFISWSVVSVFWSGPGVLESMLFLGTFIGAVLFGVCLAVYSRPDDAGKLLLVCIGALVLASVLVILLIPSIGTVETIRPGGEVVTRLTGVFAWNSDLGLIAGFLAVVSLAYWFRRRQARFLVVSGAAGVLTVASESATAIVGTLVAGAVVLSIRSRLARRLLSLAAAAVGLVALSGGTTALIGSAFEIVGRSPDLTGRSVIWSYTADLAIQRSASGYGIGAAPDLSETFGFELTHAHNGYLQLFLELGIVGVLLFCGSLVFTLLRVIRSGDELFAGVITMFIVCNFANNYLMYAGIVMVLYTWVAFASLVSSAPNSGGLRRSASNQGLRGQVPWSGAPADPSGRR